LEKKKQAKEAQKALWLTEEDTDIDEDDSVEEATDETTSA
jgi:hypothetical protein